MVTKLRADQPQRTGKRRRPALRYRHRRGDRRHRSDRLRAGLPGAGRAASCSASVPRSWWGGPGRPAGCRLGVPRRSPVLAGLPGPGDTVAPGGCDAETTYHCALVRKDTAEQRAHLVLDSSPLLRRPGRSHARWCSRTSRPSRRHSTRLYPGPGAPRLPPRRRRPDVPRYLDRSPPGTDSVVSEIDPGVVRVDRDALGSFRTGGAAPTYAGRGGRLGLRGLTRQRAVNWWVGDAFGGLSVPWHLTTRRGR